MKLSFYDSHNDIRKKTHLATKNVIFEFKILMKALETIWNCTFSRLYFKVIVNNNDVYDNFELKSKIYSFVLP